MFTSKNFFSLVLVALMVSSGSQALAKPSGFLDKAENASKLVNDSENGDIKSVEKDVTSFKKKPAAKATPAAPTGTAPSKAPAAPTATSGTK
jgi:hypothetical protein